MNRVRVEGSSREDCWWKEGKEREGDRARLAQPSLRCARAGGGTVGDGSGELLGKSAIFGVGTDSSACSSYSGADTQRDDEESIVWLRFEVHCEW